MFGTQHSIDVSIVERQVDRAALVGLDDFVNEPLDCCLVGNVVRAWYPGPRG